MLRKLINAARALKNLPDQFADFDQRLTERLARLERNVLVAPMSPIDRHVTLYTSNRADALFDLSYPPWRTKRITKLIEMYGPDGLKGKRILEVGAGLCEIGAFFAELGADVTCLEGRTETVTFARLKHRRVQNLRIEVCDLESDFSGYGHFDLILHFGLLYHLNNVDSHLANCFKMSDDIVLETVVCDSLDPFKIVHVPSRKDVIEESIHGFGCRPSPYYVERLADENGFEVIRHFSSDLNAFNGQFIYDWQHKNDGDLGGFHLRRFWRFRRRNH